MPSWKCPLCGRSYRSDSEQRPLVCQQCASQFEFPESDENQKQAFHSEDADDDVDKDRSTGRRERGNVPKATALIGSVVGIAFVGAILLWLTPLAGLFAKSPRFIVDETFEMGNARERRFRTDAPWSLEWSVASREKPCLSSIQIWDAQDQRIGVFGSHSGIEDFDSVGEHRIVVYPAHKDRVHVIARER